MATSQFVAPSRHLISAEAFQRMGEVGILGPADRVELIAGEIIDMSPSGAMHAAIVDVLARHFGRRAREALFVRCQNPLRLDDLSEPEPSVRERLHRRGERGAGRIAGVLGRGR
jgi:hypothetical protein